MAPPKLTVVDAGAEPTVVDKVLLLPTAQVEFGERLRPIDQRRAEVLAGLIRVHGQDAPIEVCRLPGKTTWLLVTGGHRLTACAIAGVSVRAIEVTAERAERRRKEISENLFHGELEPLDRAAFVAEFLEIGRAAAGIEPNQDGRAASAAARWQKELKSQADDASVTMTLAYGWADDAAAAFGLSRETIYRDLALHRGLPPSIVAAIRGLPIASSAGQLRALAKLSEADQRAVVRLLQEGVAKGATDALGILRQKPQPNPSKKALSAFVGSWARMTPQDQREALRLLSELKMPRGVKLQLQGLGRD